MAALPDVPGVRHEFVELATGVRAHVAHAGPADGPPLLLLHGWPQHWYLWRDVIARLRDRYRLICPDLRGFGWSGPAPDGDYRKRRLAEDALALLDHLGIERAGLVGHDWGGWAGWLLCLHAPQRLRGFLALNIVHPWQPRRRLLVTGWRLTYQGLLGAPWLGARVVRDGQAMRALMRSSMDDATIDVFLARVREHPERSVALYRQFLLREAPALPAAVRGRRIELPVRVLFGCRDGAQTPLQLRGLRTHAPDCAIELVDATHFVVDQRPDLVAARAHALFAGR